MRFLILILALFFLHLAGPAVAQSDDRGFIQGLLEDNLSGVGRDVRIVGFAGALSSRATIQTLTIADADGIWLTMNDVALQWNRGQLVRGRLDIAEISAAEVILQRAPKPSGADLPTPEATPFALPELPVSVEIGDLSIQKLLLGASVLGTEAQFSVQGSATLIEGVGKADLSVIRTGAAPDGKIVFQGAFSNADRVLALFLDAQEAEGGIAATLLGLPGAPAADLQISGEGPISDYEAQLALVTDGVPRLAGVVRLSAESDPDLPTQLRRGFLVSLDGDLRPLVEPQYRDFLGPEQRLYAMGTQHGDGRTTLDALEVSAAAMRISGQMATDTTGWPIKIDLSGFVSPPQGDNILLSLPGVETRIAGAQFALEHDANVSQTWEMELELDKLVRPDLLLERATLVGSGTLTPDLRRAQGIVTLELDGIAPTDPVLAAAIGARLTGGLSFLWNQGAALRLTKMDLSGSDYGFTGDVSIQGVSDAVDVAITGAGRLNARDLSRFAGLSGVDLAGEAALELQGQLSPLSGAFNVDILGNASGLASGLTALDPLIAGDTRVTLKALRDETGVTLETLEVTGAAVQIKASGEVATTQSDLNFSLNLDSLGRVLAGADGPVSVVGRAVGRDAAWQVSTDLSAPGRTQLGFVGAVEVIDGAVGAFSGALNLSVAELERYAALAERTLGGAISLSGRIDGSMITPSMTFALDGSGQDLVAGVAQLDPLLAGETELTVRATGLVDTLEIAQLEVQTPTARVSASGTVKAGESDLEFALALDDTGVIVDGLSGPAQIRGTAGHLGDNIRADVTGSAPGETDFTFDGGLSLVDGSVGPVTGKLTLNSKRIETFAALVQQTMTGALSLAIDGEGDLRETSFSGNVSAKGQDLALGIPQVDPLLAGVSEIQAKLALANGTVTLSRLEARTDEARVVASGTVSLTQSRVELDARLRDVGLLLEGLSGPATLSGNAGHLGAVISLDAEATGPGAAQITIDGGGTLIGGRLGPVFGVAGVKIARLADYAALAGRPISGSLDAEIGGQGDLRERSLAATIDGTGRNLAFGVAQADEVLAGNTVLSAAISARPERLLIERLLVTSPAARVAASGTLAPAESEVQFDVTLDRPGGLVPNLPGPLSATGTATHSPEVATVLADLSAPGASSGTLDLRLSFLDGAARALSGNFDLRADRLAPYAGLAKIPLDGALALKGTGAFDLVDKSFSSRFSANGRSLRVGIDAVDTLLSGASRATGQVARAPDGALTFALDGLETPLVLMQGAGAMSGSAMDVSANATLRNVSQFVPGLVGAAQVSLAARSGGGPLEVTLIAQGPSGTNARVTGQLARNAAQAALRLSGAAPLGLANRFIAPNLLEGQAAFDLTLNGPLALSSLAGQITSTGGRLTVPAARLGLTDINAQATIAGASADLSLSGGITTGGRFTITGQTGLGAPFDANIKAALSGVRVVEPGVYESSLSGEMFLRGPLTGGAAITGAFDIGQTEIRIPEVTSSENGEIVGLIHLNEPAAVRQTRRFAGLLTEPSSGPKANFPVDLTIRAPSRIFIRGRGLDAELGGSLRLRGTTQNVITEGQFALIRGRLDFLAQRLDLTEASATLQGDFNPFIRAVARTTRDETDIQITVEGLASAPDVRFSSSPDLPQDEILALLLFGRNISEVSPLQALRLANAIRILAGSGGDGIVGRLRQNFGLDDLDVSTDENNEATVRVGKYINERVYSDVTVGTSGRTEINLNLSLSPGLTARGSVSNDGNTGVGLFFEKDY